MMHRGRVVLEAAGKQKRRLSFPELVSRFQSVDKDAVLEDRTLLEVTWWEK
jgi:ABC-type uncharacterized transport system ATPase component